jgi:hypothetical protein
MHTRIASRSDALEWLDTLMETDDTPRIGNRSDALDLLDALVKANVAKYYRKLLPALRDAIEREIL